MVHLKKSVLSLVVAGSLLVGAGTTMAMSDQISKAITDAYNGIVSAYTPQIVDAINTEAQSVSAGMPDSIQKTIKASMDDLKSYAEYMKTSGKQRIDDFAKQEKDQLQQKLADKAYDAKNQLANVQEEAIYKAQQDIDNAFQAELAKIKP